MTLRAKTLAIAAPLIVIWLTVGHYATHLVANLTAYGLATLCAALAGVALAEPNTKQ